MQLTICAGDGKVRPALIFRGTSDSYYWKSKPRDYKPDPDQGFPVDCRCEADLWADGVAVHFNENAWATPKYSRQWASDVFAQDVDDSEENLLFADNLGGQGSGCGEKFKQILREDANTLVWNLPKNCTDEVQPVDAGYGFDVRREVGNQFTLWLDAGDNCDLWHSDDGLPAYKRRVLMTRWVKAACDKFNDQPGRVRGFFERTGCLLAHDGHTDKLIKLEGLERPYDYLVEGKPAAVPQPADSDSEDDDDYLSLSSDEEEEPTIASVADEEEDVEPEDANEDVDADDVALSAAPDAPHVNGFDSLGDGSITDQQDVPAELTSAFMKDYLDPPELVITTLPQALGTTWEGHDAGVPRVGAHVAYCFAPGEDMGGWEIGRLCKQERPLSSQLWAVKFPSEEYRWRVELNAEKKMDSARGGQEDDTFCWTIVRVRPIYAPSASSFAVPLPPPPPPPPPPPAAAAAAAAGTAVVAAAVAAAGTAAVVAAGTAAVVAAAGAAAVAEPAAAVVAAAASSSSSSLD